MAIKSILVAYSGKASGSGGLRYALQLARRCGAHLTGVVSHGPSFLEAQYSRYQMDADVLEILRSRDTEAVSEIRAEFEARVAAEGEGITADFLDLNARRGFTLTEYARVHDIVVMGRRASVPGREHFGVRPEEVALDGGRPVILVPADYSAQSLGERVLVAWDGNRAAARSLGDALHVIEPGAPLTVLSVTRDGSVPLGSEIGALLERHGIRAETITRAPDGMTVTARILETCRERDADLLVMGAYQHSRAMEDIFGGVTRDIMENAHLPVLMSH